MTSPSTNFFYGGAGLTGAPLGIISTTDAIYQPLAARQVLNARHWDIQSAKNDALLADRRRLLHGAPVPGDLCRHPLHGRAGARPGRADRRPEPRPGLQRSRSTGPGTWSPTSSSRPSRRGSSGAVQSADSRRCSGSTPRGGRTAGARPPPDHPDRPGPGARRPDADRPDQPPRDRLTPGADRGGGGGGPPGEGSAIHPHSSCSTASRPPLAC